METKLKAAITARTRVRSVLTKEMVVLVLKPWAK